MTELLTTDVTNLTLAQMAALYNLYSVKPVTKFSSRAEAERRVLKLADGRAIEVADDGTHMFEQLVPADVTTTVDEPLPTSHVDTGSRFDVYAPPADAEKPAKPEYPRYPTKSVEMGDALQQVLGATAKSDVPPPAPATPAEKVAKAPKAKKPKPASTGARGPAPRYTDAMRITFIQPNPRRPGAESHERYALYTIGMTVAEYIQTCLEKYGRDRARWLTDVRWDAEAGHIRVEA